MIGSSASRPSCALPRGVGAVRLGCLLALGACGDPPLPHRREVPPDVAPPTPAPTQTASMPAPSSSALASAAPMPSAGLPQPVAITTTATKPASRAEIEANLSGVRPTSFGSDAVGVVQRFNSKRQELALTVDLCDGHDESSYDDELFEFLQDQDIAVTVFITAKWAKNHTTELRWLKDEPRFEIANHGEKHKPCSVTGRSAFGIPGTRSLGEALDEIENSAKLLEGMVGKRPKFYRSGTAHFDDVCTRASEMFGERPVGFSVAGDGGAGFDAKAVERALTKAETGSIVILHGHRPNRFAFEGLRAALPALREKETRFVQLGEVADRLVAVTPKR